MCDCKFASVHIIARTQWHIHTQSVRYTIKTIHGWCNGQNTEHWRSRFEHSAYHRSTSHIYCMHIWIELLVDWWVCVCVDTNSTFHKLDYYQYVRQVQSTFAMMLLDLFLSCFILVAKFVLFVSNRILFNADRILFGSVLCSYTMWSWEDVSLSTSIIFPQFTHMVCVCVQSTRAYIKCPYFYDNVFFFFQFESNFTHAIKRTNSNKSKFTIFEHTTHTCDIYNL